MTAEPVRPVLINEILANASDPNNNFIELYNHANSQVTIDGYKLSYKPSGSQTTYDYIFPTGTTIPARGFIAVWQGGTGRPTLGFNLNINGGSLYFKNPANPTTTRILDSILFGPQDSGVSVGRFGDGAPGLQELSNSTQPGSRQQRHQYPGYCHQ